LEGLKHVKQIGKLRNDNGVDHPICRVFSLEKIIIFQVLIPALPFGLQKLCFFFFGSFFWFKPKKRTAVKR
jgi:hypothetical protein